MKRIVMLILVLSMKLFAQHVHPSPNATTLTMSGSLTVTGNNVSYDTNLSPCTGSASCWHDIGGSSNLVGSSASADGSLILFWGPTGIWLYDPSTQLFTGQPQYGSTAVSSVAVGSPSEIYGVSTTQGPCAPSYEVMQWNGSAWAFTGGCSTVIAATSDALFAIGGGPALYYLKNGAWVQIPANLPGSGTITGLSVTQDDKTVALVRGGQVYSTDVTTSYATWTAVGANIGAVGVSALYIPNFTSSTPLLMLYATTPAKTCLSQCIPAGYSLNAFPAGSSSWSPLTGKGVSGKIGATYSMLYSADIGTGTTGPAERYSTVAAVWTHSFQVHTVCNPSPCPGTVHTYHSDMTLAGVTKHSYSTGPANQIGQHTAVGEFDPLVTIQTTDGVIDNADCPIAGNNFTNGGSGDPPIPPGFEKHVDMTAFNGDITYYNYIEYTPYTASMDGIFNITANACAPATSSPCHKNSQPVEDNHADCNTAIAGYCTIDKLESALLQDADLSGIGKGGAVRQVYAAFNSKGTLICGAPIAVFVKEVAFQPCN